MINSSKDCILSEIIFTQCKTKCSNEEYILCNSMLLAEIFYSLYGNLCGFSVVSFGCRNRAVFIRVEVYASAGFLKYRSIVIFCILVSIAVRCIYFIKRQVIGSVFFRFQFLSTVGSVDIIDYNSKRGCMASAGCRLTKASPIYHRTLSD